MIKAPSSVTCHGQQDARCLSFTNEAVPRSAQVTKCIASMASSDGVAGANQEASQRQRWKSSTAMTRAASQLRIRPPARPPVCSTPHVNTYRDDVFLVFSTEEPRPLQECKNLPHVRRVVVLHLPHKSDSETAAGPIPSRGATAACYSPRMRYHAGRGEES